MNATEQKNTPRGKRGVPEKHRSDSCAAHCPADWTKLKGKPFQFAFEGDRYDGVHHGRIIAVNAGPRRGLKCLRVATQSYAGRDAAGVDRWKRGRVWLLSADQARGRDCGIELRGSPRGKSNGGRIVPIDEFLDSPSPATPGGRRSARSHRPCMDRADNAAPSAGRTADPPSPAPTLPPANVLDVVGQGAIFP